MSEKTSKEEGSSSPRQSGGGGGGSQRFLLIGLLILVVGVYTFWDDQSLLSAYKLPTRDAPRTAINRTKHHHDHNQQQQEQPQQEQQQQQQHEEPLVATTHPDAQEATADDMALDMLAEEETLQEEEEQQHQGENVDEEIPLKNDDAADQQEQQQPNDEKPADNNPPETVVVVENTAAVDKTPNEKEKKKTDFKFYILQLPSMTTDLMANNTAHFSKIYQNEINEASTEVWLHRGMASLTYEQGQTMDPNEADVFIIPAYLWARDKMIPNKAERNDMYKDVMKAIVDKTKPHVWFSPLPNPNLAKSMGSNSCIKKLVSANVNMYSIGLERNTYWQALSTDRIIPVPYVLHPSDQIEQAFTHNRTENFVFFRADRRRMARDWAGCDRAIVTPLFNESNMDIGLSGKGAPSGGGARLSQNQYNHRMSTSDYCLVMCGDTPTTRSLISSMTAGCIPILVGRWWYGHCDPPCHSGWGWNIAERPHFPFADQINWNLIPQVNHSEFERDPKATLQKMFLQYPKQRKDRIRAEMKRVQKWLIYGWGDPTDSTQFGDAYPHIWESIIHFIGLRNSTNSAPEEQR